MINLSKVQERKLKKALKEGKAQVNLTIRKIQVCDTGLNIPLTKMEMKHIEKNGSTKIHLKKTRLEKIKKKTGGWIAPVLGAVATIAPEIISAIKPEPEQIPYVEAMVKKNKQLNSKHPWGNSGSKRGGFLSGIVATLPILGSLAELHPEYSNPIMSEYQQARHNAIRNRK